MQMFNQHVSTRKLEDRVEIKYLDYKMEALGGAAVSNGWKTISDNINMKYSKISQQTIECVKRMK